MSHKDAYEKVIPILQVFANVLSDTTKTPTDEFFDIIKKSLELEWTKYDASGAVVNTIKTSFYRTIAEILSEMSTGASLFSYDASTEANMRKTFQDLYSQTNHLDKIVQLVVKGYFDRILQDTPSFDTSVFTQLEQDFKFLLDPSNMNKYLPSRINNASQLVTISISGTMAEFTSRNADFQFLTQMQEFNFEDLAFCPDENVSSVLRVLKSNCAFLYYHGDAHAPRLSVLVKCKDKDSKFSTFVIELLPFRVDDPAGTGTFKTCFTLARHLMYNDNQSELMKPIETLQDLHKQVVRYISKDNKVKDFRWLQKSELADILEWMYTGDLKEEYRPREICLNKEKREKQLIDENFSLVVESFNRHTSRNPPLSKWDVQRLLACHIRCKKHLRHRKFEDWKGLKEKHYWKNFKLMEDLVQKDPRFLADKTKLWSVPLSPEQAEHYFSERFDGLTGLQAEQFAMTYVSDQHFQEKLDTFCIVRRKKWNSWTTVGSSVDSSQYTHDQIKFVGTGFVALNEKNKKDLHEITSSIADHHLKMELETMLDIKLYPGASGGAPVIGSPDLSANHMIALGKTLNHVYGLSDDQVFRLLRHANVNGRAIFVGTSNPAYFFAYFQAKDIGEDRFLFTKPSTSCDWLNEEFEKKADINAPFVIYKQGISIVPSQSGDSFVFQVDHHTQVKMIPTTGKERSQRARELETVVDRTVRHPDGRLYSKYHPAAVLTAKYKYNVFKPPKIEETPKVDFYTISTLLCHMGIQEMKTSMIRNAWKMVYNTPVSETLFDN